MMKIEFMLHLLWIRQFSGALTTCGCTDDASEQWLLPSAGASASIVSRADDTQCWQLTKTSGGITCDGLCVVLGPCTSTSTPTWSVEGDLIKATSPANVSGWCLDQNTVELYLQAYPNCITGDTHQDWSSDSQGRIHEGWTGQNLCIGGGTPSAPCPPPPPPLFCYAYHPLHSPGLYDPSGPILAPDGTWHVWEDEGSWSHWTSSNLLHWEQEQPSSTGFDGLTGSVAVTPSGIYAFWPSSSQNGILSAVSTDASGLTNWTFRGQAIAAPAMAGSNFRDPLRAFQAEPDGPWFVGVGCNNNSQTADLCLFRAADDNLSTFSFIGTMYSTNSTYGTMDENIVWQNTSVHATMMECPDIFQLPSSRWMLIGSLFSTNQWWIGAIGGDPKTPQFIPETVGMIDYGNFYAAKTGSTFTASPSDRRVLFGFTGWSEPTANPQCGRALAIPRDITLSADGRSPLINPIPELLSLRNVSSHMQSHILHSESAPLPGGAQVWVSVVCTLPAPAPSNGSVYVRLLGTQDGSAYTEVGYDFGSEALYADQSRCCAGKNSIVQRAPASLPGLNLLLNITILVDGGLVESFLNGAVTLTSMVNPDPNVGAPSDRTTVATNDAGMGVRCATQGWQMNSITSGRGAARKRYWSKK